MGAKAQELIRIVENRIAATMQGYNGFETSGAFWKQAYY
jgi:hypothetical protein